MTILVAREVRRRERPANETRRSGDLTPAEAANVRAALIFLRARLRGNAKLAAVLKTTHATVNRFCSTRGYPSAGIAIRVARVAGVDVEAVLHGEWPPEGACH